MQQYSQSLHVFIVLPPSAYVSDPYPSCSPLAQVPSYLAMDTVDCLTP